MELTADIHTTRDMLDASRLSLVEEVLDKSPIASVVKLDTNDPLRKRATQFRGELTKFIEGTAIDSYYWLRQEGPYVPMSGYDEGFSDISIDLYRNSFTEEEIKEFRKLFVDIAVAVDAFYGRSAEISMYTQRNELMKKSTWTSFSVRLFPNFNKELPDVYWLNYFGLGYVDFWGKEKIKSLSDEYEVSNFENGGICVQTSPEFVTADKHIKKVSGYNFKKHFYNVLGSDTFMHETQKPGEPGKYVPTLDDHRNLLKHKQSC